MTVDDMVSILHLTPENADEKVKKLRTMYWGFCGVDIEYDCSPRGITLNGITGRKGAEIHMTWDEMITYVKQPKQITFEGWN